MPSPGRMASMHARNQGCRDGPCRLGMERMIRFYFPSPAFYRLMKVREAGTRVSAAALPFRGNNMDEHATDRAPGTRVGQRHFLEPSLADTAAPTPAAPPEAQGLYDPQHEHDACGVGFVVDLKGRQVARRSSRRACRCCINLAASRRLRLRGEHRRRRRHPDADAASSSSRKVAPSSASSCPRRAATAPAWSSCRTTPAQRATCEALLREIVGEEGQRVLGWRDVPDRRLDDRRRARARRAGDPPDLHRRAAPATSASTDARAVRAQAVRDPQADRERGRRARHRRARKAFYVVSLSADTLHLQGHADGGPGRAEFYPDLSDPASSRRWRWSTRASAPTRSRAGRCAHPYRYLAHNGEINTLRGNINWMHAREGAVRSRRCSATTCRSCCPIIHEGGSDSAMLRQRARVAGA